MCVCKGTRGSPRTACKKSGLSAVAMRVQESNLGCQAGSKHLYSLSHLPGLNLDRRIGSGEGRDLYGKEERVKVFAYVLIQMNKTSKNLGARSTRCKSLYSLEVSIHFSSQWSNIFDQKSSAFVVLCNKVTFS